MEQKKSQTSIQKTHNDTSKTQTNRQKTYSDVAKMYREKHEVQADQENIGMKNKSNE